MKELIVKGYKPIYKGIPPFMKYTKGYGFYGVLLEEEKTGKLQCHLCGKAILSIGKHIFHKHKNITIKEYRIEVGLSITTPLVSESTRKKMKNNFLNLTEKKKDEVIKRLRNLNKRLHSTGTKKQRLNKASIQTNNRYGTCPEQVRSLFLNIYNKEKKIPARDSLPGRLKYVIETRFGSYEEALVAWGIPRKEYKQHIRDIQNKQYETRRMNDFFPKYTEVEVRKQYTDFFNLKKRMPTWGEVSAYGMPGRLIFKKVFGCSKKQLQNILSNNN